MSCWRTGSRRIGFAMSPGRFDKKRDTSKLVCDRAAKPMMRGSTTSIRNGTISIGSTIAFDRRTAARSLPITARTAVQLIGARADGAAAVAGTGAGAGAVALAIGPVLAELRFDREVDVLERRCPRNGAVHGNLATDEHRDDRRHRVTVVDADAQTGRGRLGRL